MTTAIKWIKRGAQCVQFVGSREIVCKRHDVSVAVFVQKKDATFLEIYASILRHENLPCTAHEQLCLSVEKKQHLKHAATEYVKANIDAFGIGWTMFPLWSEDGCFVARVNGLSNGQHFIDILPLTHDEKYRAETGYTFFVCR